MSSDANLFVIIVTFNNWHGLKSLLPQLVTGQMMDYTIIIVDDGSTDGTIENCKRLFPRLLLIENKANLGFTKSANKGIQFALANRASHVLFLSPDLTIGENFIASLFTKNVDILGPVIINDAKGKRMYAIGGRLSKVLLNPKIVWQSTKPPSSFNTSPQFLSRTCMLLKKKVFEKVGLFDEQFITYYADISLCLLAKKRGLKIAIEPKALCAIQKKPAVLHSKRIRVKTLYHDRVLFAKHLSWWLYGLERLRVFMVLKVLPFSNTKNVLAYDL